MRRVDDDRMLDLVGQTYDAALDDTLWAGLAGKVANAFEASSMSLRLRRSGGGKSVLLASTDNLLFTHAQEYASYYWRHDKWATRGAALGLSKIVVSKELISDEELVRSEWYWDWVRKADIFYIIGVVFPVGDGDLLGLGIHRPQREAEFEKQDKRPLAQFLPHLKRALQLRRRLFASQIERDATFDALDRTGIATFVVAQDGLILYANRRAEIIAQRGDGIRASHNRLRAADHDAGKTLALAIRTSVDIAAGKSPAAPSRAMAIRRTSGLPLTLLVSPFRPARDGFGLTVPAAIVLVRDPEWPTASDLALQGMFGLTPTEACITRELASGRSVTEIAARHGITVSTTRTHIKTILAKTGTNRQPELVALVTATVAFLQDPPDV